MQVARSIASADQSGGSKVVHVVQCLSLLYTLSLELLEESARGERDLVNDIEHALLIRRIYIKQQLS